MVFIHVIKDLEDQFLYETTVSIKISDLCSNLVEIYNGRLKIERISQEIEQLADYGPMLPPELIGLTDDQIKELELIESWEKKFYIDSKCYEIVNDPFRRRNGRKVNPDLTRYLKKAARTAEDLISNRLIEEKKTITMKTIQEVIEYLRQAVLRVYPQNLPSYDIIRLELENSEDLTGNYALLNVLDPKVTQLWFCGKELYRKFTLEEYIGKNEKILMIMKLVKRGDPPPLLEHPIPKEERNRLLLESFRKSQKMKENKELEVYEGEWADSKSYKKSCHSLDNIKLKPT